MADKIKIRYPISYYYILEIHCETSEFCNSEKPINFAIATMLMEFSMKAESFSIALFYFLTDKHKYVETLVAHVRC